MSIQAIRFRTQEALVVLQVFEYKSHEQGSYYSRPAEWRDAKVEDLLDVARFTGEDLRTQLSAMSNERDMLRDALRHQATVAAQD